MSSLEYLKKAAKNLFKDWKSHTVTVEPDGFKLFEYNSHFFDFNDFVVYYDLSVEDEENFSLMKAQHMIAQMAGYRKWNDLINASEKELELAKILISHFYDSGDVEDWEAYKAISGFNNFDIDSKIKIARHYYEDSHDFEEKIPDPKILQGKEREIALNKELMNFGKSNFNEKVRCLHCGKTYLLSEATVVLFYGDKEPMVMCKHFPQCNGSLIDMFTVKETL